MKGLSVCEQEKGNDGREGAGSCQIQQCLFVYVIRKQSMSQGEDVTVS